MLESGRISEHFGGSPRDAQEAVNRRRDLCLNGGFSVSGPLSYTGLELWVALYAYTIQIYYDFSAYTDIAIGSALLFGIRLPENLRRPIRPLRLLSSGDAGTSPSAIGCETTFITLLVVQGRIKRSVYLNIILTMVVIGIWHGASWNFVIYGCLHGSAVSLNRFFRQRHGRRPGEPLPGPWAWAWRFFLTFNFVVWARVLFGTANLVDARDFLRGMLDLNLTLSDVRFPPEAWVVLALGYAWHYPSALDPRLGSMFRQAPPAAQAVVAALIGGLLEAPWTAAFFLFNWVVCEIALKCCKIRTSDPRIELPAAIGWS